MFPDFGVFRFIYHPLEDTLIIFLINNLGLIEKEDDIIKTKVITLINSHPKMYQLTSLKLIGVSLIPTGKTITPGELNGRTLRCNTPHKKLGHFLIVFFWNMC